MVGYAVGEMERATAAKDDKDTSATKKPGITQTAEDGDENLDETKFGVVSRKSSPSHNNRSCYEVVTAWVHPR